MPTIVVKFEESEEVFSVSDSFDPVAPHQLIERVIVDPMSIQSVQQLLHALTQAFSVHATGIVWPLTPPFGIHHLFTDGHLIPPGSEAWWLDFHERLFVPESGVSELLDWHGKGIRRLAILVQVPFRSPFIIWLQVEGEEDWSNSLKSGFRLLAVVLQRSKILSRLTGSELDQSQLSNRLNDAALFAGRLAHDFDNILTGVLGFTDLALPLIPNGSVPHQHMLEVSRAGQRGIQLTQQLHQFNRSATIRPQPSAVAGVAAKEIARLKTTSPQCKVQLQLPADLPPVALEGAALQIVLGHILENAVEAVRGDSVIELVAKVADLTEENAVKYLGTVQPGAHVILQVRDFGPGIKPDLKRKLFLEPFTTTKVRHRGLGLAICYRILSAHRGGLLLESEPDRGTKVHMVIPVSSARLSSSSLLSGSSISPKPQGGKSS